MTNRYSIAEATAALAANFGLTPIVACEIEFYLHHALPELEDFWDALRQRCAAAGIGIYNIGKETGADQHEIALLPDHPQQAADHLRVLTSMLLEMAAEQGMRADFSAKPFADQPGSGLHVHVHLNDNEGKNVFYKDDARISDALFFSIGGLLALLPASMSVFAPNDASYARFIGKTNAPTTVSWGANNRTVAVRLPDSPHEKKRIEHRVAGADADGAQVIGVILTAMHWGLKNKAEPGAQIYGDAADAQYKLKKLPISLTEALQSRN